MLYSITQEWKKEDEKNGKDLKNYIGRRKAQKTAIRGKTQEGQAYA